MNIKIELNSIEAYDILVKYCVDNKVSYDTLVLTKVCIVVIDNPSDEVLAAVYRFADALRNMVDVKVKICS